MRLLCTFALALAVGCGSTPADMGAPDAACQAPMPDGGGQACSDSRTCAQGFSCQSGTCAAINTCASDCGCTPLGTTDRTCSSGQCVPPDGQPCGPCGPACDNAGGTCRNGSCATYCNDDTVYCPKGFRCDIPGTQKAGVCVPALADSCAGCAQDADCPTGEVCNLNNRLCVPAPTGPDARIELAALDFGYDDNGTWKNTRNLTWSIGFFTYRDPSYDPWDLQPMQCVSVRSSFTENAPFPVGPLKDAGAHLMLTLPAKTLDFARQKDPNPSFGYTYAPMGVMVSDYTSGAAMWSGAGGTDVGAFTASGAVPDDYTTTPDVLAKDPVPGDGANGVVVMLSPAAATGVRTIAELSWNEIKGNTVLSLNQVACRAPDGATSVTIPPAMLANVPRGSALGFTVYRGTVADFTTRGVQQGRAVWAVEKTGSVLLSP